MPLCLYFVISQNLVIGDEDEGPHSSALGSLRDNATYLGKNVEYKTRLTGLAKTVTLNDLRKYFHLPITQVAKEMGEHIRILCST